MSPLCIVLKARHLSGSAFCTCILCIVNVPEQALGWFPVDLGLVLKDEPSVCTCTLNGCYTRCLTYMKVQKAHLLQSIPDLGETIPPVPAQAHLYTCAKGRAAELGMAYYIQVLFEN